MYQNPKDRNPIRRSQQCFPFITAQIKCKSPRPRHIDRAASSLEDVIHEGFGDGVDDSFEGEIAEFGGLGLVGLPDEPEDVGGSVDGWEAGGDVLGLDAVVG